MADPWAEFRTGTAGSAGDPWAEFRSATPEQPEDVTAGMALRGIPVLGAYIPQAEAAIRAAAQPLTGVGEPGATWSERYAANLPKRQADYAQAEREQPIASTALQVGGGMAALAPLGATALGARALGAAGPWAARLPASIASGAGIAAADAAARGQDPTSAAMLGGGVGAAAPFVGAAAGRLGRAVTGRGPGPSIEQLKTAAGTGYEEARNLGVAIRPQAADDLAVNLKTALTESGLDDNIAPKTWGILSKLEGAPPDAVMTVQNFQSLRRTLGNAAGSNDRSERLAAVQAKQAVDEFLANLPNKAVLAGDPKKAAALLREANANHAAAERAAEVDRRIVRAELRAAHANSGMNVANTVRARLADILVTPSLQRGYSPQELAKMESIVRGGAVGNALRYTGNLLGGGGGLGQLAATAAGGGAAYAFDDPRFLALPLAGIGARMGSNALTMRQANQLSTMLRSRAPLAGQQPFRTTASPNSLAAMLPFAMQQWGQ